jgi:hypothetical protein
MNAGPLLVEIGCRLHEVGLDAVLIGNAAALQGAPVTTVDFDFFFRKTPRNLTRLKARARSLRATILRPYYPASDFYRVVRARATSIELGDVSIRVATLADVIKSKRAAGRPRDLAVLEVLETALEEGTKPPRSARRSDVKASSRAARARVI